MLTLIILGYVGIVMLTFTVIKIKVSHRSLGLFALIGIILMGLVVNLWKFSSPMTDKMIVKRNVIFLFPGQESKELISKIHVPQNQMVKKGTPLYEYDTRPNQYALDQAKSQLAASQAKITELEASVELAAANVAAADANLAYKKSQLDSALTTQKLDPAAIAELEVEVQRENFAAAQAGVEQAKAAQQEAEFALSSAQEAIKATEAQVSTAKLNLEQNVVRAPADGFLTNFQAVEGTMGTPLAYQQQGSFMDMTETAVAAIFPMNVVQHVAPGDHVEIAFKSLPGQLVTGKVDQVLEYTGEGQLNVSGTIPQAKSIGSKGMLAVRILLDDPELAKRLPLGGAGTTAIYTDYAKPFHIITRISVRMKMWMNYAPI
jgi:membrane fusion protein (multidrug efflux system)